MTSNYRRAVLEGAKNAARMHFQLGSQDRIKQGNSYVDVFSAITRLGLPLLFRPLNGLLGAYLTQPKPGVLVTTKCPLSVQRFTAAHELGHHCLGHDFSLDDISILPESREIDTQNRDLCEVEADAFAASFLVPKWLIKWQLDHHSWRSNSLNDPGVVYQISLRIGASFQATLRALHQYKFIDDQAEKLMKTTKVFSLKKALLRDYKPSDFRRDVWLLTEHDSGANLRVGKYDLFVIRLREHSGAGYVWGTEELRQNGFALLSDIREEISIRTVGTDTYRQFTTMPDCPTFGKLRIGERRPWDKTQELRHFETSLQLTGPEKAGVARSALLRKVEVSENG